jgi:hypothetical protein
VTVELGEGEDTGRRANPALAALLAVRLTPRDVADDRHAH